MKTIMLVAYLFTNGGGFEAISHADMGPDWRGDWPCLVRFANALSKETGMHIQPVNLYSGAEEPGRFRNRHWNAALDAAQQCYDPQG